MRETGQFIGEILTLDVPVILMNVVIADLRPGAAFVGTRQRNGYGCDTPVVGREPERKVVGAIHQPENRVEACGSSLSGNEAARCRRLFRTHEQLLGHAQQRVADLRVPQQGIDSGRMVEQQGQGRHAGVRNRCGPNQLYKVVRLFRPVFARLP